jgi:hypothetical protein
MTNIEKIQNLTVEDTRHLLKNLVLRLGYSDVKIQENSILAELESPLSSDIHQFIIYQEKLSGDIDCARIGKSIIDGQKATLSNVVHIVSNSHISKGFKANIAQEIGNIKLNFLDRDSLIELLNQHYKDFWKHDDLSLIEYEKSFCSTITKENDIKKLKLFNDKYQKLLDIFIEPRIYHTYEEKSTNTPVRKRADIHKLIEDSKNKLISGDAGTGKTTLLKEIGKNLVEKNSQEASKFVPVFITTVDLHENGYNLDQILSHKLSPNFQNFGNELFSVYNIILLIDSIDEFNSSTQKQIIADLNQLSKQRSIQYYIGTRNHEKISSHYDDDGFNIYQIEKFNNDQIRKFVSSFFLDEKNRADELIESLRENRIIERMPITPLTLSLISILYEENNLEVPATIADIYDNFNSLIIGRSSVASRIEFIDISFKERILSLYALQILKAKNHTPYTVDEFYDFFNDYYEEKTLPIKKGTLKEVLEYLIEHTGILVLRDEKWVKFTHDSYMEYYASLEIFKHQREKENLLVDNFLNHHWQNTAIFYAGKSKDLPKFLEKIIDKIVSVENLQESFMGILGIGYLLQALFQTDNKLRKRAVLVALRLSVNTYQTTMKLASDNTYLFKNYKLPILQLMNLMYFYENFNSLTVKEPLKLAFQSVLDDYKKTNNSIDGFKAIKLALTLDSKRIRHEKALTDLIEEKKIFADPSLYLLIEFGMELLGKEKYRALKNEIKKDHYRRISAPVRKLIDLPASRLRFTSLDTFNDNKNIKLIVEGKTDAEIIEHAYFVLSNGSLPYWNINSAGNTSGGAHEVHKSLMSAKSIKEEDSIIIGIFDHDSAGLQEFRGLKKIFSVQRADTLKKHDDDDVYAICIPVPGELDYYLQKQQEYNTFAIEHYFDETILREQGLLEDTPIDSVYKIKDSKKKGFSSWIRKQSDPKLFRNFIELFKLIDELANIEMEYVE